MQEQLQGTGQCRRNVTGPREAIAIASAVGILEASIKLLEQQLRSQGPGSERVRVCGEKGARATTSLPAEPGTSVVGQGMDIRSAQTSMRRRRIRGPNLFGGEAQERTGQRAAR